MMRLRVARVMMVEVQPAVLARLAVRALVAEAELTPKPALVDRRGSGAHHDLTLQLMLASAYALETWFCEMAEVAQRLAIGLELRERLAAIGRDAERAMLRVTGGVNTHRGAIWTLGLLVAGSYHGDTAEEICVAAGGLASLPDRFAPAIVSHGLRASRKYGVGGARGEAAAGFPHVVGFGLPALCEARTQGASDEEARLRSLLAVMSHLPDTCLLHRGGPAALAAAQRGARRCLESGGVKEFDILEAELMGLWASPGGSADLLAATIFLDSLTWDYAAPLAPGVRRLSDQGLGPRLISDGPLALSTAHRSSAERSGL